MSDEEEADPSPGLADGQVQIADVVQITVGGRKNAWYPSITHIDGHRFCKLEKWDIDRHLYVSYDVRVTSLEIVYVLWHVHGSHHDFMSTCLNAIMPFLSAMTCFPMKFRLNHG